MYHVDKKIVSRGSPGETSLNKSEIVIHSSFEPNVESDVFFTLSFCNNCRYTTNEKIIRICKLNWVE